MRTEFDQEYPKSPPQPGLPSSPCPPTAALSSAATCHETMRLVRRMLARMLWPQLAFGERARLAREVRRLAEDLALALLILEKGRGPEPHAPIQASARP